MLNIYQYHSQPEQLIGYSDKDEKIPGFAWEKYKNSKEELKKREHLWVQDPRLAHRYAKSVIRGRWPPGEAAIASHPEWVYWYAYYVIKGIHGNNRWPPGEAAIAIDPQWACEYAKNVIEGRWPPGEAAIAIDPHTAYEYARYAIEGRFPEGEAAIVSHPDLAYLYAKYVIKGRFPEGEAAIASNYHLATDYKELLRSINA